MQNDKKAYMDETKANIDRQTSTINRLKDENKQLCKEMLKISQNRRTQSKEREIN